MPGYRFSVMGLPVLDRIGEDGAPHRLELTCANLNLLALLAVHGAHGQVSREAAAELLWPECDPGQSRSRLSSALWRLRKAGEGLIAETPGRIALSQAVIVDIWDMDRLARGLRAKPFEAWVNADFEALEAVVNMRRGPFLDELDGEWVRAARQDCTATYEFALECLVRFHRMKGNRDRSIDAARHLVSEDPYREDIHAVLVELYTEQGQRGRAVAQYNTCRQIIRSELGVDPGPEIRLSLMKALEPRKGAPACGADVSALISRIDESMENLARHIAELRLRLAPPNPPEEALFQRRQSRQ